MKEAIYKGGAITSAVAYLFCWQLPLVLASFGLGSFTFALWIAKYRWVFLAVTVFLLGLSFYRTYGSGRKAGKWSIGMLYGTTVLCIGLVVSTLLYR